MSGLVKAKEYDWKDSNLALFGSDLDKQVKKESAETEPAWQGAGTGVGLRRWRINKFQVENVDDSEGNPGDFFTGDSYICLNTYKDEDCDQLLYDVHFWIGEKSTQDEYGTAAYKTVELDTYLDDAAIQHRETQQHESDLFKSYFKSITCLSGGHDTGFRHVTPETYEPRLLRFCFEKGQTNVTEVPKFQKFVERHPSDVYVLDKGDVLLRYDGGNVKEKIAATQYLDDLLQQRGDASVDVVEMRTLMNELDGEGDVEEEEPLCQSEPKLFRVSDADGSLDMEEVKTGEVTQDDLDSKDVFIIDRGDKVIVWIGSQASPQEKKNGFAYADNYTKGLPNGPRMSIDVVKEGTKCSRSLW